MSLVRKTTGTRNLGERQVGGYKTTDRAQSPRRGPKADSSHPKLLAKSPGEATSMQAMH
jgi:hypothetical protein